MKKHQVTSIRRINGMRSLIVGYEGTRLEPRGLSAGMDAHSRTMAVNRLTGFPSDSGAPPLRTLREHSQHNGQQHLMMSRHLKDDDEGGNGHLRLASGAAEVAITVLRLKEEERGVGTAQTPIRSAARRWGSGGRLDGRARGRREYPPSRTKGRRRGPRSSRWRRSSQPAATSPG